MTALNDDDIRNTLNTALGQDAETVRRAIADYLTGHPDGGRQAVEELDAKLRTLNSSGEVNWRAFVRVLAEYAVQPRG